MRLNIIADKVLLLCHSKQWDQHCCRISPIQESLSNNKKSPKLEPVLQSSQTPVQLILHRSQPNCGWNRGYTPKQQHPNKTANELLMSQCQELEDTHKASLSLCWQVKAVFSTNRPAQY